MGPRKHISQLTRAKRKNRLRFSQTEIRSELSLSRCDYVCRYTEPRVPQERKIFQSTTVAELIKKSRGMIQLKVKIFNEGGLETMALNSPPGRPSSLSEGKKESLKADMLTHPHELGHGFSNWKGKSVAYHIKQKFHIELSVRQAQRLLHELGFTLQCPKYKFPKADLEKQKEFLNDFKKVWALSEKIA